MLNELGCQQLPGKKACVLISSGKSTRENGYLDRTLEQLKIAGVDYVIYDKFTENPLKEHCEEGGKFARENACDFIVALRCIILTVSNTYIDAGGYAHE